MTMKTALLCAALGLTAGVSGVASARTYVDIDIAPPPPREEVVPGPRVGFVWAPGYWDYNGRHHEWRKGHWVHERHGHHWVNDEWVQRDGRWHHERGHWD
jgi:hypothetical protein